VVAQNLRACALTGDKARLETGDAYAFLRNNQGKQFDLIFLDPPYGGELLQKALNDISLFDILAEDGIIICEHGVADQVDFDLPGLSLLKQYKYGQILITKVGKA
jgi:16S rRNA G966 N2-methylase RsmD